MKTISAFTTFGVPLGLALQLASSAPALAQTFYSLGGGLNVSRTVGSVYPGASGSTEPGFTVQASVGRRLSRRHSARLDVFVSQFGFTQPAHYGGVLCVVHPPPGTCCGICPFGTSRSVFGVVGLAASELVSLVPSASGLGLYLIAGAETDYLYDHPSTQGALRLGGSAGAGVAVPLGGRFEAFVEARYHGLVGVSGPPAWLLPVNFGIRL